MKKLVNRIQQKLTHQPRWLTIGTVVAVSFVIFLLSIAAAHKDYTYSSDDVAQQTIMSQQGKYGSHNVWLGVDNFILKLPLYQLINTWFGQSRTALLLTVLLLNAIAFIGIVAALYIVWREELRAVRTKITPVLWYGLLMLFWIATLGGDFAIALINPNVRNAEVGLCIFLAVLTLAWARSVNQKWYWGGLIGVIIGLFLFNDPYFLYTLFAPLAVVPLFYYFFNKEDSVKTRLLPLYGVLLVAAIVYKGSLWGAGALGFHVYDADVSFASLATFGTNLTNSATSFLSIFHGNFFGMPIGQVSLRTGLNAVIAVLLVGLTVRYIIRRRQLAPQATLFGLTIIATIVLYALTTSSNMAASARYLVLLPVSLVFLVPFLLTDLKNARRRWALVSMLVVASLSNLYTVIHAAALPSAAPNSANSHVAEELKKLGLTKGYAAYWDGNITTYLSDGQTLTIPVVCDGTSLHIYYWLMDSAWLQKPVSTTYLIANNTQQSFKDCTPDKINKQFGLPSKHIMLDQTRDMYIYNYDIYVRLMAPDSKQTYHINRRNVPIT